MEKLSLFVSEFVQEVTRDDAPKIDYILLSGSAARGDFRDGTSDIDLIIKATDVAHVRPLIAKADRIFWRLDEKYKLNQRELFEHKMDSRLIPLGRSSKYAVTVFSRLPRKSIGTYFDLLHKELIRARGKPHMKLLYGKRFSRLVYDDPLSLLLTYSLAVSLVAIPIFILAPSRAFKSSVRAVLFTFDLHLSGSGWKKETAARAWDAKTSSVQSRSYFSKAAYCLAAPFLIFANNVSDLAIKLRTGKLPEELKGT